MISSLESPMVAEIWSDFGFCGIVFESGWWVLVGVEIGVVGGGFCGGGDGGFVVGFLL